MPFRWTPDSERAMLVHVIATADIKPTTEVWNDVAQRIGGGLNGNAVRYSVIPSSYHHRYKSSVLIVSLVRNSTNSNVKRKLC